MKKQKNEDQQLGGAIVKPNIQKIVPPDIPSVYQNPAEKIHMLLQQNARHEFESQEMLRQVADSLIDYRPRNIINYDQYLHHFHGFPEEKLMTDLEKSFSGNGASRDDPKLHQLFMDSFKHHPELVSLYAKR